MDNRTLILEDDKPKVFVLTIGVYDPKEGFRPPKDLYLNYVIRCDKPNSLCGILARRISTILVYEFGSAVLCRGSFKGNFGKVAPHIFFLKVPDIEEL